MRNGPDEFNWVQPDEARIADPAPLPQPAPMSDERAIRDLRWYAERLCVDKPERYEVYQTADGVETKLSDAVRALLAEHDRLRTVAFDILRSHGELTNEVLRLRTASASGDAVRLVEDAERYRYLREHHLRIRSERMMAGNTRPCLTMFDYALPYGTPTGSDANVDAAIDAERAALLRPTSSASAQEGT